MVLGFSDPSWDTRKGCWGQELLKLVEQLESVELMEPMEPVELTKPQWPWGSPGATDVVSAGAVTSGAAGASCASVLVGPGFALLFVGSGLVWVS